MSENSEQLPAAGARPVATQTADEAASAVQQMFDSIAPRYDRLNHVLSFGMDHVWWRRAATAFQQKLADPTVNVVDLCCGTADMTAALLQLRPADGHAITAVDFSHEMIERGRAKLRGKAVNFIEADALALPLPDASQQLVVSAFGFRNLSDYTGGLREIRRVLSAGGEIGILDFSMPTGVFGALYRTYFRNVLPRIGGMLSGSAASYAYLPASVERFPAPQAFCAMISDAGFANATWTPYLFGVAGLWRARAV